MIVKREFRDETKAKLTVELKLQEQRIEAVAMAKNLTDRLIDAQNQNEPVLFTRLEVRYACDAFAEYAVKVAGEYEKVDAETQRMYVNAHSASQQKELTIQELLSQLKEQSDRIQELNERLSKHEQKN